MGESTSGRSRRSRRNGVVLAAATGIVVALTATAVVAGERFKSPQQAFAETAPPPSSAITATAERRTLFEPIVLRGTIKPGPSIKIVPSTAAVGESSVVTKVQVAVGDRVPEGAVLLVRSGEPMIGLVLKFPLYRDLHRGLEGPDVQEVQRALRRIGYRTSTNSVFGSETEEAVRRLYRDRGMRLATTPSPAERAKADDAGKSPTPAPSPTGPAVETPPSVVLTRSSVVLLDRAGRKVSKVKVRVGSVLNDPAASLLELDSGAPSITAPLAPDQAGMVSVNQAATVTDDLTGEQLQTRILAVGTGAAAEDGKSDRAGMALTLAGSQGLLSKAAGRSFRVEIRPPVGAEAVLAVPITAIYSRADGNTFVTVLTGGRPLDVPVQPGQVAGGWVEIRRADGPLADGTTVVIGSDTAPAADIPGK
ncbi:peptidoglycan-binding protein [Micromonospora ureilytica]|uniref:peptidoglycan-binding protein n=1 Tax=Micromonospora ureilytica TaxID=709868 RepID=UPI004039BA6E